MGRITSKYLKMNSVVKNIIESEMKFLIPEEKKVLGIHFRGTDFKKNYNGHPISLTLKDYLPEIEKVMQKNYDLIFLATDDSDAMEYLRKLYGDKLVYYSDVVRSNKDETVMKSTSDRFNHHYMLGLEVLRDMHTLARCDSLIAGLSQVSIAARIQKSSYGCSYDELIIINKGINSHKKLNCPN